MLHNHFSSVVCETICGQSFIALCVCVPVTRTVHVCIVHIYVVINLAADGMKHLTPAALQNGYKDVSEHRQQSMTEQALRERE